MFCSNYEALESALTKRGFIVHSVKDAEEARQLAFSLIKKVEKGFKNLLLKRLRVIVVAIREP